MNTCGVCSGDSIGEHAVGCSVRLEERLDRIIELLETLVSYGHPYDEGGSSD